MLRGVRDFLVANPGEVLIFVIEDYVAPPDVAARVPGERARASRLSRRGEPPWPTLGELAAATSACSSSARTTPPGVHWFTPLRGLPGDALQVPDRSPSRASPNRGGTAGSLFQINHWIETPPSRSRRTRAIVNAHDFLLARAGRCQQERGRLPNILAVDFAGTGDVVGVAAELNGLAPAAEEGTP